MTTQLSEKDIRELKDLLEIIKDKTHHMDIFLGVTMSSVRDIRDQLSVMNKKIDQTKADLNDTRKELSEKIQELGLELKEVKNTQEKSVLPSVTFIEKHIKGFGDAYKENTRNA